MSYTREEKIFKNMNNRARIRIAIRNFFKTYGRVVFIIFIVWLIVFLINQYLKLMPKEIPMSNSYTPDSPIMDETDALSLGMKKQINNLIKEYIDYCNNKDYNNAYNMLTTSCKNYVFGDNEENFKSYVNDLFPEPRKYYTQNYSNVDGIYVYILTLTDDIESTGTTGGYYNHSERIAILNEGSELKLSVDNFIMSKDLNISKEDDYMKVEVTSKDIGYGRVAYNLKITNKTDGYILISDNTYAREVSLIVGNQERGAQNLDNVINYVAPGTTGEMSFTFTKYLDEENSESAIQLNDVRILKTLNTTDSYNDSLKVYSFNINLDEN